jgi:ubiquinol-cytochrome c reductase cytochrome b subunit
MKKPRPLRWTDERLEIAGVGRSALGKVFPDHWSFMLGEIALYAFVFLVASGVYLALFFDPSTAKEFYQGSYAPMRGHEFSAAYVSTVRLSWDVRGGLLVRQAHHWAAHIFIGAIVLHVCRIFFTGAFRKPREMNWLVGVTLLILAILNAFFGYSMPDDLLSGTGLRIFWSVMISIPVVGPWLAFLVFGGDFPGPDIILRLFTLHILVIPALIAILITVHLGGIIRQKHTHFSGPGRRDANVVGSRMWPTYALRSLALLFAVFAVSLLLGGLAQINPIWVWGDYKPYAITSPSVADWYIVWIEGALRLFPPADFTIFGYLVPSQFWPGVVLPGVTFALLYAWPFLDRRLTGDRETHHITGRPRDCPLRTAIGIGALTFFAVLIVAGGEELLSQWTRWPVEEIRSVLRGVALGLPLITGVLTYFIVRRLRQSEKASLLEISTEDLLTLKPEHEVAAMGPTLGEQTGPGERALSETPTWLRVGRASKAEQVPETTSEPPPEGRTLAEVPSWVRRRLPPDSGS